MVPATSRFMRPLAPRDPSESHRVASPLELLTDLCFVVAVSQAALSLEGAIADGLLGSGLIRFAMVFFAIWWAWLNFTWFASAYDNDDVVYRVLTILQILGSLVLAAGISRMFDGEFVLGVAGYVIMRLALVAQWFRAARFDPERRSTCLRYAYGIIAVQCLWVTILVIPDQFSRAAFLVFVACELAVPVWAERPNQTPWHPHHIAERYGAFFIIVLGETILSTTIAIKSAIDTEGSHPEVAAVALGGLLIVFSVWWLYFSRDAGEMLARAQGGPTSIEYVFGFGHYFIFASAAAIGAALAARVEYWLHPEEVSELQTATAVTGSVAVLLASMWVVLVRRHDSSWRTAGPFAVTIALVLLSTFGPAPEVLAGVLCASLLALELVVAGLVAPTD